MDTACSITQAVPSMKVNGMQTSNMVMENSHSRMAASSQVSLLFLLVICYLFQVELNACRLIVFGLQLADGRGLE